MQFSQQSTSQHSQSTGFSHRYCTNKNNMKSVYNFIMVERYQIEERWSTVRKFIPSPSPWLCVQYTEVDLGKRFGNNPQGCVPMGLSILLAQNLYEDERKYTFNIVTCVAIMFFIDCFSKLWLLYSVLFDQYLMSTP